ncbi:hypothetical protein [Streptomyces sp. S1]|uniref:hypothetical protein n=1 Tax=Streptomyces sp. S1 TaxID=718288 RepID=UPI003D738000
MASDDHVCGDECVPPCDHCGLCGHSVEDCHHEYCYPARGEHSADCVRDARRTLASVDPPPTPPEPCCRECRGPWCDCDEPPHTCPACTGEPGPDSVDHQCCIDADTPGDVCDTPCWLDGGGALPSLAEQDAQADIWADVLGSGEPCCGDPDGCCGCTCEPPSDYELAHGIDVPADDCGVHGTDGCIAAGLVADTGTDGWRRYRQASGHWGVGVSRSPSGWHVTVGPWCWTTEGA